MITREQALRGASMGGRARAKSLSARRRSEIAKNAARARWEPASSSPRQALTAAELKALRAASGLGQAALAKRVGIARSTLATIEQGRAPITDAMAERLRRALAGTP